MKKLSALIMFTLLATAGYYIGNAVAQNKTSADQQAPDGVLVVEETYGVAVPVQAASPTADSAAGSAAGTVSPDYPQSGFHHAVSATERPPVKRRCQKTADGARLRSDQTGGQDPMGRDPRAGRCLDSSHRDIAVTKRRSRFFHTCASPKRSLHRISADLSLCKAVHHVTYCWKL